MFVDYLMLKANLVEEQWSYYGWIDFWIHPFTKGISLEVNLTEQLEFELASIETRVQYFSHYTTGNTGYAEVALYIINVTLLYHSVYNVRYL